MFEFLILDVLFLFGVLFCVGVLLLVCYLIVCLGGLM